MIRQIKKTMAVKQELYPRIKHPDSLTRVHPDDQFLSFLHILQEGYAFDEIGISESVQYGASSTSLSHFQNIAVVMRPDIFLQDIAAELNYVEHYFRFWKIRAEPALYLREGNDALERKLRKKGWTKGVREVVMTHDDVISDPATHPGTAIAVTTPKQWRDFSRMLQQARNDSDINANPHGPILAEEIPLFDADQHNPWRYSHMTHFLVYDSVDNNGIKPVAGAVLISDKRIGGVGYIQNVGAAVKRQGYVGTALHACLQESLHQGNSFHCLTTTADSVPQRAFEKYGWQAKITAAVWTKNEQGTRWIKKQLQYS